VGSCIAIGPGIEEGQPFRCQGSPRAVSTAGFVSVADRLDLTRTPNGALNIRKVTVILDTQITLPGDALLYYM
jgi:hypothetical protein